MLAKAISLVAQAFEGDHDKGGKPYIMHCLHVMYKVQHLGVEAMIAAVMHDLLEDKPKQWDAQKLINEGFDPHTVSVILLLTHDRHQPYHDYIMSLSVSPIARAIKMADLRHNSDVHRMKGLAPKDHIRIEKYHKAYAFLRGIDD